MKPILKWAGGKTKLLPDLELAIGSGGTLYEPFGGSMAVGSHFLSKRLFNKVIAYDFNNDLVNLYMVVQGQLELFIEEVQKLFVDENLVEDCYYEIRAEFNNNRKTFTKPNVRMAALFLYLNKFGFNGICRYSKNGFNVPFGKKTSVPSPDIENIREFSKIKFEIYNEDFRIAMCDVLLNGVEGDVLYLDPPYVSLTQVAGFVNYTEGGFGNREQEHLAVFAELISKRGIKVVISNHDTEYSRLLYKNATEIRELEVQRSISPKGDERKKVKELIAIYKGQQ